MKDPITESDGHYLHQGVSYDSLTDAVLMGVLGFCGCGDPEEAADYVAKGLRLIHEWKTTGWVLGEQHGWESPEYVVWEQHHDEQLEEVLGQGQMFFYYWAADKDLTEHGGAVPGWLTDDGLEVLELLERRGEGIR